MAYKVSDVLTMAQRFLVDVDDAAYKDSSDNQPMLDYFNEGCRRFSAETHCCQAIKDVSVTAQSITHAVIISAIGSAAQGIVTIAKVTPKTGTNYEPLPKAPMSESKALLAAAVTTPTRWSHFAEAIYFDTHPDTTLSFDATIACSYITADLASVAADILIPDEWVQAIAKYIVFCCRITDRDAGMANGAYAEFEEIKKAAALVYISQFEKVPGAV